MQDLAVRSEVQELEQRLAAVEGLPDSEPRALALAAIEGLLGLYGEALARIVAVAGASRGVVESLRDDELVSHLLLLHGLHPASLQERVAQALEEVRPYMGSHGGGIELIEIRDGVARVRLEGTCQGCAASTLTLKLAVEEAILRAAPELDGVEAVEPGGVDSPLGGPVLTVLEAPAAGRWLPVDEAGQFDHGGPVRRDVGGASLLFMRSGDDLYAYVDRCPACRAPLEDPTLDGHALRCGGCGRRYDVRRAGVGVDGGLLGLDPVPLLVERGRVRVAVEAGVA